MTLTTTETVATLVGDDATTLIPVPFAFLGASDLEVVDRTDATGEEALLELGGDYTVSGGNGETGALTLTAPSAAGHTYFVRRVTAKTQPTDYVENGAFPADTHERALDRVMMVAQESDREAGDALRYAKSDLESSKARLPSSTVRAGKYLTFDASGKPEAINGMTDVSAVAAFASEIVALDAIVAEIATVAGIHGDVTAVSAVAGDLPAVTAIASAVSAVAAIDTETASVAGIGADVSAVAANETNIDAVAAALGGGGLTLVDTDEGATEGPVLTLYRDSSSPTDGDLLGALKFDGNNDAGTPQQVSYGYIESRIIDSSEGAEYGAFDMYVMRNGSPAVAASFLTRVTGDLAGFLIAKSAFDISAPGLQISHGTALNVTVDQGQCYVANRLTDDGDLFLFRQDGTIEGTISVSGTTVSFNGGHLSRWSQLSDNSKPKIERGTVMETIPEMCVWPSEDNEQLTRSKVSLTPGSTKVSGIFSHWDDTEDPENPDLAQVNDMVLAQSGDFVVRVTGPCNEGDLLESNGDGTARVQSDDIVRASTIAKTMFGFPNSQLDKVNVVPCLLMFG